MESQGAALRELQRAYASKGVLLCGLDGIEHPYDVEDYLRHFGFSFPVFVDLNEESAPVTWASLGSIALLDRTRQRVGAGGKAQFEPVKTKEVLEKLLGALSGTNRAGAATPGVLRRAGAGREGAAPQMAVPGWKEPVRLGAGKYPRLACFGGQRVLCVWVAGEVPQQHLEYAICEGGQWKPARRISTGLDAHGVAVDVDGRGYPVIAWAQKDPPGYRVYFGRYEGTEWREPVAISPAGNGAFRPDVFCGPAGETSLTWFGWKRVRLRDYPNAWWRSIYVSEVVSNRPGDARELAELRRGSDDCWDPVLTGMGKERQVTWLRDENPPKLWGSAGGAGGWSRPEGVLRVPAVVGRGLRVQACSPIRGSSGRSGVVFELFSPGGYHPFLAGTHVYLSWYRTNGWTEPVSVSAGPGRHIAPVSVELAGGKQVVLWCHLPGKGKPSVIRMREMKGTGEGSEERVFVSGECASSYPSVSAESTGGLWVAWQEEEANGSSGIWVSSGTTRRAGL